MALQNTPTNKSFLSPLGFKFSVKKLPNVNYFCTSASIPDITMGQIDTVENTFIKLPVPGDKLSFNPLSINFTVDEDMKNFMEIYNWIIGLGYPDNFQQYAGIKKGGIQPIGEVYSDATLIITTSSYQPNIEVKFIDMYPVSIGQLDFDITNSDVEFLQGTASFAYRKYELTSIV